MFIGIITIQYSLITDGDEFELGLGDPNRA